MKTAGEHQHIEWKQSWRDEYLRWVCAFANAEGGTLVIGRNDRGEAVGVANAATKTLDLLLTKYQKALISYEGVQRVETYPVPEEALREAVLNAIAHKDYASAVPIQISVYADRIMLWNPGHLSPDWTVERLLQKHSSQPYNPDVANAFFRAGMIEAWGRGIERIMSACQQAGTPAPAVEYETTGLWLVFHFLPQHRSSAEATPPEISAKTSVKTSVKILQLEKNPEMTLAEVAEEIGRSLRAIELASSKLVKAGRLKYVGPKKGGRWEVLK